MLSESCKQVLFEAATFGLRAVRGTKLSRFAFLRSLWCRLVDFCRPRGMVLREIHGSSMYLDADDRGLGLAMLSGVFEPYETDLFARCIRDSMTVVDVGANIGYYSLLAARRVGNRGRVFAVEPNPVTRQILLQNVALNRYDNIIPINRCVSNRAGQARFHINRKSKGESSMLPPCETDPADVVPVETVTLDDLLPDGTADILKIDIEGAEGLALMGASGILRNGQPLIFMEFVPSLLSKMGTPPGDIIRMVRRHGYCVYLINEKGCALEPIGDDWAASAGNLFCAPLGKAERLLAEESGGKARE